MQEFIQSLLEESVKTSLSDVERKEVTQNLLDLYKNPESLLSLIQIVKCSSNIVLKQSASIALKYSLKNCWLSHFADNFDSNEIKKGLIDLVFCEKGTYHLTIIINALNYVFETDANDWPEFIMSAKELFLSQDQQIIVSSITMMRSILNYLNEENAIFNVPFLEEIVLTCIRISNMDMIVLCSELLVVIFKIVPKESIGVFQEAFINVLSFFFDSVKNNYFRTTPLANQISEAISTGNSINDAPNMLSLFFSFLSETSISSNQYVPCFMIIESMLQPYSNSLKPFVNDIVKFAYEFCVISYSETSFEHAETPRYICSVIESACRFLHGEDFFQIIFSCVKNGNEGEIVTSLMMIYYCVEYMEDEILSNLNFVVNFALEFVSSESIHIKEMAIMLVQEVSLSLTIDHVDIATKMIKSLCDPLMSSNYDLVRSSLKALSDILRCGQIETSILEPLLGLLMSLLEESLPSSLVHLVIQCLSDIVFASKEEIIPYVESIYPLLCEAANVSEDSDPILKGNALMALGYLVRFAPSELDSIIDQILTTLSQTGMSNDDHLRNAVIESFGNIVLSKNSHLIHFSEQIDQIISFCFQIEVFGEEEDTNGDPINRPDALACLEDVLLLIKCIFKLYPEILPIDYSKWIESSLLIIGTQLRDLIIPSLGLLTYATLFTKEITLIEQTINIVENLIEDSSDVVIVNSCFKVLYRFVGNGIHDSFDISQFIALALKGISKKLECQNSDGNDEAESSIPSLYKFLQVVWQKVPDIFPVNDFLDMSRPIFCSRINSDKQSYCKILYSFVESSWEKFQSIQRKVIVKSLMSGISSCDFHVVPESLMAVRKIINTYPSIFNINTILENLEILFELEHAGEKHYWSTMSNAISLLFNLLQINPAIVKLDFWIPLVLPHLPLKCDPIIAHEVYSSVLSIFVSNNIIRNDNIMDYFRFFCLFLSQHDKAFLKINISLESTNLMINTIKEVINSHPDSEILLNDLISDESSLIVLYNRLGIQKQIE